MLVRGGMGPGSRAHRLAGGSARRPGAAGLGRVGDAGLRLGPVLPCSQRLGRSTSRHGLSACLCARPAAPPSKAAPTNGRYRQAPHASSAARGLTAQDRTDQAARACDDCEPYPSLYRNYETYRSDLSCAASSTLAYTGNTPAMHGRVRTRRTLPRAPESTRSPLASRARVRARTRTPMLAQSMNDRSERSAMTCGVTGHGLREHRPEVRGVSDV